MYAPSGDDQYKVYIVDERTCSRARRGTALFIESSKSRRRASCFVFATTERRDGRPPLRC